MFGSKIGTNSHQDKIESKFKKHFIHLNISFYLQVNLETYCSKLNGESVLITQVISENLSPEPQFYPNLGVVYPLVLIGACLN